VRGRERRYRLEPAPLAEIEAWAGSFRPTWDAALDALETEVHRTRRQRRQHPPSAAGRTA
jgi:hypothetical protein